MPLLGVTISHHSCCLCNNSSAYRTVVGNDRGVGLGLASAFSWKAFCITKRVGQSFNLGRNEVWPSGNMIKAVSTLEITSSAGNREVVEGNMLRVDNQIIRPTPPVVELQALSEEVTEVDEGEKLVQTRRSRANKGFTPWNKGKKHSLVTIQRIKERTRLAMQDPKVKMKMQRINLGNSHTEQTKRKIGEGVRLGWERRRQRLMPQETCHYEWKNLIAVAACKGFLGEEALEWDSYENLEKQLKQEWLKNVKERKYTLRTKGNKRAAKSDEQRRKISTAISAKWADPEYRGRVLGGMAKFRGILEKVERKLKKKPSGDGQAQKRNPPKKDETNDLKKHDSKNQVQRVTLKRGKAAPYKDLFSSSKLKMLKNIRAQRSATLNQKSEAISRAKFLINKAERAAAALEMAAQHSPSVWTALVESRMLIAEANKILESVGNEDPISCGNGNHPNDKNLNIISHNEVNGVHGLFSGDIRVEFSKFLLPNLGNGKDSNSHHSDLHDPVQMISSYVVHHTEFAGDREKPLVNGLEFQSEGAEGPKKQGKRVKKWIRGRLIEVVEDN